MLCLSDHQTMAYKDQSKIPKATFIEIGVYAFIGQVLFCVLREVDKKVEKNKAN